MMLAFWDQNVEPVMTFPIKKKIYTRLFIDRKLGIGIQQCSGKIEEGEMTLAGNWNVGMRTENDSLLGMTNCKLRMTN